MSSPFQQATKVALEEILKKNLTPSKYGYFLDDDDLSQILDDLGQFLVNSRNFKAAGDKLLQEPAPSGTGGFSRLGRKPFVRS